MIAIERFQKASNLFLHCYKIGKFSKFAMFLLHADNYSHCAPQRAACYETLCSSMALYQSTFCYKNVIASAYALTLCFSEYNESFESFCDNTEMIFSDHNHA